MRRREFITLGGSGILPIVFFTGLAMFPANSQEKTGGWAFSRPEQPSPVLPEVFEKQPCEYSQTEGSARGEILFICLRRPKDIHRACRNLPKCLPSSTST